MNIEKLITDRLLKPVQKDNKVYVYNGDDKLVQIYNTLDLGREYFSMSNDAFYDTYGFNFVPRGDWWAICKRASGKL